MMIYHSPGAFHSPDAPKTTRPRSRKELREAAFHEAGHGVMCRLVGLPLRRVTIERDDETFSLGRVEHTVGRVKSESYNLCGSTWQHDRLALIAVAGAVGELSIPARLKLYVEWGLDSGEFGFEVDQRNVVTAAYSRFGRCDERTAQAWVEYIWHRGIDLLTSFGWPSVERLAAALLKQPTMKGAEAMKASSVGFDDGDRDHFERATDRGRRIARKLHGVECPFAFTGFG